MHSNHKIHQFGVQISNIQVVSVRGFCFWKGCQVNKTDKKRRQRLGTNRIRFSQARSIMTPNPK